MNILLVRSRRCFSFDRLGRNTLHGGFAQGLTVGLTGHVEGDRLLMSRLPVELLTDEQLKHLRAREPLEKDFDRARLRGNETLVVERLLKVLGVVVAGLNEDGHEHVTQPLLALVQRETEARLLQEGELLLQVEFKEFRKDLNRLRPLERGRCSEKIQIIDRAASEVIGDIIVDGTETIVVDVHDQQIGRVLHKKILVLSEIVLARAKDADDVRRGRLNDVEHQRGKDWHVGMWPRERVEQTEKRIDQACQWTEIVTNEDQLLLVENGREDLDDVI